MHRGVQQLPLKHTCPLLQVLHVPPQPSLIPHFPAGQFGAQQLPPTHVSTLGQAGHPIVPPQPSLMLPHCPLVQVAFGVQQAFWYSTCPLGHWHWPLLQVLPPVHCVPHPPQLLLSVEVSTQEVPQVVFAHVVEQAPFEQV